MQKVYVATLFVFIDEYIKKKYKVFQKVARLGVAEAKTYQNGFKTRINIGKDFGKWVFQIVML